MATQPVHSSTSTIDIYIKLAQYPILSDQIRERMREELFRRGVISEDAFEAEVRQMAIESQRREGIHDPFSMEPTRSGSSAKSASASSTLISTSLTICLASCSSRLSRRYYNSSRCLPKTRTSPLTRRLHPGPCCSSRASCTNGCRRKSANMLTTTWRKLRWS
jgi:hypothetical protein